VKRVDCGLAGFTVLVATSARVRTLASIPQLDGPVTLVAIAGSPGRPRVDGVCVAKTTVRHVRRVLQVGAIARGRLRSLPAITSALTPDPS
jgi:hypothetical protein